MDDETRKLVLNEEMNGKLDTILEYVKDIPTIKNDVAALKGGMREVQSDVAAIKHVVREHSADIDRLKTEHVR